MIKNLALIILGFCLTHCVNDSEYQITLKHKIDSVQNLLTRTRNTINYNHVIRQDSLNFNIDVIDSSLDTCSFLEILDEMQNLNFFYSDLHCSSCLEKQLAKLKEIEIEKGPQSICILASVSSFRGVASLIRHNDLKCKIYMIGGRNSIVNSFKNIEDPFYFEIDQNGHVTNSHFPMTEDTTSTNIFLSFFN